MAKVSFKFTDSAPEHFKLSETKSKLIPPYVEGQILFVKGNGEGQIYLDFNDSRLCFSGVPKSSMTGKMNYLGISTTDPKTEVTINGTIVTPKEYDMVVYKTKEYMYRHGKDEEGKDLGLGWYEIGDEESPEWSY